MKEFIQAVLISAGLVASVGFITNGFTFSPERETMPAMGYDRHVGNGSYY